MHKLTRKPQESNFVVALQISLKLYMGPPLGHLDLHGSVRVCEVVAFAYSGVCHTVQMHTQLQDYLVG